MQIVLQPHIGVHAKSKAEVDLGQDLVFVDGRHVGYVVRQPGAPLNFIARLPEATKRAVLEHVTTARGAAPSHSSEPPVIPTRTSRTKSAG